MKRWLPAATFAAGLTAGCMAAGTQLPAQQPSSTTPAASSRAFPLILDRTDLRIGTSVHFDRLPTAGDVNDLRAVRGLAHVVLSLASWPEDLTQVAALEGVPDESDVIVLLPGYPPYRGAGDVWNAIGGRVRAVLLVQGPPANPAVLDELNAMRALERVVAEMDDPSRSGFERLQRPLSFRKIAP